MGVADRQPNSHEQSRGEQMILVVELGPESERAAGAIHLVVGEVDDALVRRLVVAFIGQANLDGNLA